MNPRKLEMKEIKLNCDRFRPQSATCSRAGRRVWQLFFFCYFRGFFEKKIFKHNSKFNRTIEDLRIISRIVWNLLVKPESIPPSHVRLHQNFCIYRWKAHIFCFKNLYLVSSLQLPISPCLLLITTKCGVCGVLWCFLHMYR